MNLKKIFINSFLPIFAGALLTAGIIYAWTEPTVAPPGNNVEAPVNVGSLAQLKNGVLGVLGLLVYNDFDHNGVDVTGKVLTAQNAYGAAAWAAGGGGGFFTYYCNSSGGTATTNLCPDSPGSGAQGYCPSGFKQIYDLGSWGYCCSFDATSTNCTFRLAGTACPILPWDVPSYNHGKAYVCSQ